MRRVFIYISGLFFLLDAIGIVHAQPDGFLKNGERILFPIGFYEHPKEIEQLRRMAESGVNLVHCYSREDLDQAASVGILGVVPLPLQNGATDDLKNFVQSLADHPALAVWEGPDEIVWNFTAASMLYRERGVHKIPGEWWKQTDNAVDYSQKQASEIVPKMREAARMVRELDSRNRPIWVNEAIRSDLIYVRQYLEFVDITGCDYYPIKIDERPIYRMGTVTDRWMQVGQGKPVWMVLQAFAWSELGDYYGVKETAYPTFTESRFMAYDSIAHGAKGILYWGSSYLKSEKFRESLYALTSELAALQPFLSATSETDGKMNVNLIDCSFEDNSPVRGVTSFVRKWENKTIVALINEDNRFQMGVEVKGLDYLNGQSLDLLYGNERVSIEKGTLLTRMKPYEAKVFAPGKEWESQTLAGRDFIE